MLWKVALFEFRYQLRQPAFWVIFGIFFLLAFGAMASENITIGGGGAENFNSPYRVMQTLLVMSLFGIFIVTAFVSNIVLRDFDTKCAEIIFSTRIILNASTMQSSRKVNQPLTATILFRIMISRAIKTGTKPCAR